MDGVSNGDGASRGVLDETEIAFDDKVDPVGVGAFDEDGRVVGGERGARGTTETDV